MAQRPHRGARVSSFYPVQSLPPLSALDSAFQLQEYISLLTRLDVHDVDAIVSLPERAQKDTDESTDTPDPDASKDGDRRSDIAVDRACWIYEQLRRLAQDLSHPLITMLQQECTRSSCPQMKAGEWLYLCVAHGNDGAMEQCCAIDYILHTVDSATALLNSPRAFPSRLSIPQTSHRHFSSLARRLGRIFAHAYFHHRETFEQAEAESSLYARFLKLTHYFDLVPAEFLVIPESAIHQDHPEQVEPPRLLSAAVHPTPNIHHEALAASTIPDVDLVSNTRPTREAANHLGTDSPRRLGRSRTDTMVFSEALSVAEELSRNSDSDYSLSPSSIVETHSFVSGSSWAEMQSRSEAEDLDDEDGDTRSEITLTGSLSPPVETMSLIPLEDTSCLTTSSDPISHHDAPCDPLPPGPSFDTPANHTRFGGPGQVIDTPEESISTDESPTTELMPSTSEEAYATAPDVSPESPWSLPGSEQTIAGSAGDMTSLSATAEAQDGPEPDAESDAPGSLAYSLEFNEPAPAEPHPPESESDIIDEVDKLEGDPVRASEEDAVDEA